MIVVSGWIRVAAADRDPYLTSCGDAVMQAQSAPGCLDFSLTSDLSDPERINIFERWTDAESLATFRGDGTSDAQDAMILGAEVGESQVSDFEGLWRSVLYAATPEAVRRAASAMERIAALDTAYSIELTVSTDEDDPWLPSLWLTPVGTDQYVAARAGGEDRNLMTVAYGDDGDVHLNGSPTPIPGFFDVDFPSGARDAIAGWASEWIDDLWQRHVGTPAEVVIAD